MRSAIATRVVLMRHGETDWSRSGQHTGRTDIPLTPVGEGQVRAARSRLAAIDFGHVWTSPLKRARTTAHMAGFAGAIETADLLEWDYGLYEGRTALDIRSERPGWEIFSDGVPEGEPLAQVAARADRIVTAAHEADGDILIVSHGHLLRVLAARWLGLDAEFARTLAAGAASLSVLGWKRDLPVVLRWNDACHIEDDWCDHAVFPD